MDEIKTKGRKAWRDYDVDNLPIPGTEHKPVKGEIFDFVDQVQADVNSIYAQMGTDVKAYDTLPDLTAVVAPEPGVRALVVNDPTPANNGTYKKIGAAGVAGWEQYDDPNLALVLAAKADAETAQTGAEAAQAAAEDALADVTAAAGVVGSITNADLDAAPDEPLTVAKNKSGFVIAEATVDKGAAVGDLITAPRGGVQLRLDGLGEALRLEKDGALDLGLIGAEIAPSVGDGFVSFLNRARFVFYEIGSDGGVSTSSADGSAAAATGDVSPIYPAGMYLVEGRPLPLYVQNILPVLSASPAARATVESLSAVAGALPYCIQSVDMLEVDPDRVSATGKLSVRDLAVPSVRHSVDLSIAVASTPLAGAPVILCIGDSITNYQLAAKMKARLEAWGMTPTFIGTLVTDGVTHEGRGGWRYRDFTHDIATFPAPASTAAYLALSDVNRRNYNPLIRAAVGGDPAGYVKNGYVFDLANYLAQYHPGVAVTHVLLGAGRNDASDYGELAAGHVQNALDIIVPQTRAAIPGAKIALWCSALGRSAAGDLKWANGGRAVLRKLVQYERATTDPDLTTVGVWAHMDTEGGDSWPRVAAAADVYGVTSSDVNDPVHPQNTAREQLAETLAAWVANT